MPDQWQCGRFEFSLGRPILMGVVNVTPDSFSDGGQHATADEAIAHARLLVGEGAQILDIGGESTRQGSESVDVDLELARVLPIVEAMRDAGIALSVDTCKPQVMRAVLDAGADMINDITGCTDEQSRDVVARHATCGVCVMHRQGKPRTMQVAPHYDDVVVDVRTELLRRAAALQACGVARGRITVDPGFGFGKTAQQNYALLHNIDRLVDTGYPVLIGLSRKSMIGAVTGRPVGERLAGSLAAALAGIAKGVAILRVHDVAQTRDALAVWRAANEGFEAN